MIKLSAFTMDYKDPLLQKTVDSLLDNSELGDKLEVIVVLDGCWQDLKPDPRVKIVHLGRNGGMRNAINKAVAVANGEFIMRTDEHCMFGKGYDRILTETCEPNWIVNCRRFFLDPVKWEVMQELGYVDYEKLVIQDCGNGVRKFAGQPWKSRTEERKDIMIDEDMSMQGSSWLMPRAWWEKVIIELDTEHYGPLIQDSHEMIFKTWKAGGKFMLNKNTWFAHKHRSFPRTHNNGSPENPAEYEKGYAYGLEQWEDFYNKEVVPKWFR